MPKLPGKRGDLQKAPTKEDQKVELYALANKKLALDATIAKATKDKSTVVNSVFSKAEEYKLLSVKKTDEGLSHKQVTLTEVASGDKILVQLQSSKDSIQPVSNVVSLLRDKLKEDAEKYIVFTETVSLRALESLKTMGLITEEDFKSLTFNQAGTTKRIIKRVKK